MSAPATIDALRRGWCPGTLRPMETGDGWLVRLHPPGGRLVPAQLRRVAALAREHGNGLVEISARANLQIRGVTADSHPALVEALLAEELVDERDGDGPQRLTLASPLAGSLPPAEDASSLAETIEHRARDLPGLPAKIGIVVDDGGALSLDAFAADVRLRATAPGVVTIGLPGGLWFASTERDAPDAVSALLAGFLRLRGAEPESIRRLRDLGPERLANIASGAALKPVAPPTERPPSRRVGLFAHGDAFAALIGLPFGRCDADTLDRLAAAAPAGDIRFSPWRGIAFRGLSEAQARELLAHADRLGLITRDEDPRLSVQACSGAPACASAQAPAMADATQLAQSAGELLAYGIGVHVSGCIKGCAHPGPADLTLVAEAGRYRVLPGGTARDQGGEVLDLSTIMARLQPGQKLHERLTTTRRGRGG